LSWRDAAADLDEFGRLLCSGKSEDLKKIAQAMTLDTPGLIGSTAIVLES